MRLIGLNPAFSIIWRALSDDLFGVPFLRPLPGVLGAPLCPRGITYDNPTLRSLENALCAIKLLSVYGAENVNIIWDHSILINLM